MEAMRLGDLEPGARRRALVRSGATILAALALLLAALYLLPFNHFSSDRSIVRLGVVVALVAAVFILQVRRISHAELPELRAVEALGIVIGAFLVGFSATWTPAAANASIFACAVPEVPEMMAPAWPILRPGGAVTPAM